MMIETDQWDSMSHFGEYCRDIGAVGTIAHDGEINAGLNYYRIVAADNFDTRQIFKSFRKGLRRKDIDPFAHGG